MTVPDFQQLEFMTAVTEHYNGETLEYVRYDFYYWPFINSLIFGLLFAIFFSRLILEIAIRFRRKK